MSFDGTELKDALTNADAAMNVVRDLLVAEAARSIVSTATSFAPDEEDFREAIHADGPNGIHALIAVEDELEEHLRKFPRSIDAMRSSIEWDPVTRHDDTSRAALAVVNEALEKAEALWEERLADRNAPVSR